MPLTLLLLLILSAITQAVCYTHHPQVCKSWWPCACKHMQAHASVCKHARAGVLHCTPHLNPLSGLILNTTLACARTCTQHTRAAHTRIGNMHTRKIRTCTQTGFTNTLRAVACNALPSKHRQQICTCSKSRALPRHQGTTREGCTALMASRAAHPSLMQRSSASW